MSDDQPTIRPQSTTPPAAATAQLGADAVGHLAAGPAQQKLRFMAKGTAMVPHYESQAGGTRRFHGWKHDATLGPKFKMLDTLGRETGQTSHHGGFVKQLGQVVAVGVRSQFAAEYLRHLRDGDLWPGDAFTAQAAGVDFDPDYGGEHSEAAQAAHEEAIKAALALAAEATEGAQVEAAQDDGPAGPEAKG